MLILTLIVRICAGVINISVISYLQVEIINVELIFSSL